MAKNQELYTVHKAIRYHGPDHEFTGKIVTPDMEIAQEGLPMDHLDERSKNALIFNGYIQPKSKQASKKNEAGAKQ